MAEYTEIDCGSPAVASAVLDYLIEQLRDEANDNIEHVKVDADAHNSTVRITYRIERDCRWRYGMDNALIGFRDGYHAARATNQP